MEHEFTIKHKCGHKQKHTFVGKQLSDLAYMAKLVKAFNCSKCFAKLPIVKATKKLGLL